MIDSGVCHNCGKLRWIDSGDIDNISDKDKEVFERCFCNIHFINPEKIIDEKTDRILWGFYPEDFEEENHNQNLDYTKMEKRLCSLGLTIGTVKSMDRARTNYVKE